MTRLSGRAGSWLALLAVVLLSTLTPAAFGLPQTTTLENEATPTPTATPVPIRANAQDMYGIGNRLGSYFQATAFLLGFANITRLDPKSQFAGVILSFQLLVRWWARHDDHEISTSEMWISLAQILAFTSPGCLLLYLSFSYQRHEWEEEGDGFKRPMLRKDAVRGQGMNFLQASVVIWWVNITNATFSFWVIAAKNGKDYPSVNDSPENPIWMLKTGTASSNWIHWFMVIQAIVTMVCEIGPLTLYSAAWLESVKDYWSQRRSRGRYAQVNQGRVEWTDIDLPGPLKGRSTWLAIICGVLAAFYIAMLIISVESTIKSAGLQPIEDATVPGQLLPLVAGSVALVSAIANVWRPVVKVEKYSGGGRSWHPAKGNVGRHVEDVNLERFSWGHGVRNMAR